MKKSTLLTWIIVIVFICITTILYVASHKVINKKSNQLNYSKDNMEMAKGEKSVINVKDIEVKKELFGDYYQVAENILKEMTIEEKVGQMFLCRYPSSGVNEEIVNGNPGGYILFAKDFKNETIDSVKCKIDENQSNSKIKMFMAVDEEGGNVIRVSLYPQYRSSEFKSSQELWVEGGMNRIIEDSHEKNILLKSLGLNMNLTPVVDVSTNSDSYIYSRSFGKSAEETAVYTKNIIKTMNSDNMVSTMKHFPGYGDNVDTHKGIAIDERPYSVFENEDFKPFKRGIEENAPTILISHNIVKSIDENLPASLSPKINNILRNELEFSGIIMTDDLAMEAVNSYVLEGRAAVQAINAGNDIVITSSFAKHKQEVIQAIRNGKIKEETINTAVKRILACKLSYGIIETK